MREGRRVCEYVTQLAVVATTGSLTTARALLQYHRGSAWFASIKALYTSAVTIMRYQEERRQPVCATQRLVIKTYCR